MNQKGTTSTDEAAPDEDETEESGGLVHTFLDNPYSVSPFLIF